MCKSGIVLTLGPEDLSAAMETTETGKDGPDNAEREIAPDLFA